MKKVFPAILLVLCLTGRVLYAEESSEVTSGFDWDFRFGISFPFVTNIGAYSSDPGDTNDALSTAGGMLSAIVFSSLSLSTNFQYTVVPRLFAPGIGVDIHVNAPSWFIVGMFSNWEQTFLLVQPGVRLYNNFQFTKSFGITPFYGVNFLYIEFYGYKAMAPLMNAGFIMGGKDFAFEYCFIMPNKTNTWSPIIHRLGFSWSLRDRD